MMALMLVVTTVFIGFIILTAIRRDLYLLSLYSYYKSSGQLDQQFSITLSFPSQWYLRASFMFPNIFEGEPWRKNSAFSDIPRLSRRGLISGEMFHQYCNELANRMIDLSPVWLRYNRNAMREDIMMLLYQMECSDGACRV